MLKRLPVLLIALSWLLPIQAVIAQRDTAAITYTEEAADSSDFSLKEKYKYWTRANVEEKSMFKVGLSEFGWGGFIGPFIGYQSAYERKIGIPFSFLALYRHSMTGWGNNTLGADVALRYYYALPRRVMKGKSANNLSANYFSIQSNNSWNGYRTARAPGMFNSDLQIFRSNSFSLLYGLQRRLGKYGYIDVNLGYGYRPASRNVPYENAGFFDGNFSIGIAF
ncbi:MAG: hypothetical protein WBA23_02705 [Tunicatimonas sp.]|uniref:hypothetical protein n=1 Tax=Tunicatimonas sp. TaxID=1940096 RepID=UPI003C72EDC0